MGTRAPLDDRDVARTSRLVRHPAFRALFMGLAMVAAALGAPLKVEPPPPGRVPIEVVRGEDDEDDRVSSSDHAGAGPSPAEPVR